MKRASYSAFLALVLLLALICCLTPARSASDSAHGKFVIILLDQLSLREIHFYGGNELITLFDESSTALLNVRTDTGLDTTSTYTAFGAGNRGAEYGAIPGLMGKLLLENQYEVAVIGNSDYGFEEYKPAMTIASDDSGYLFFQNTSRGLLTYDPTFPKNERTDYRRLEEEFGKAYAQSDLIVLEVGDMARIKTALDRRVISQAGANALVRGTLARFDVTLSYIRRVMNLSKDRLMVIAPSPDPRQALQGYRLSWVVLAGGEYTQPCFLLTGTTRRAGLATISDLAPTILDFFQIPVPPAMNGRILRPIGSRSSASSTGFEALARRNRQIVRTSEWRPWYIKGFILVQIFLLALVAVLLFSRVTFRRRWWRGAIALILGVMWIPLLFMLLSPYQIAYFNVYLLLLPGVAGVLSWLMRRYLAGQKLLPIIILVNLTSLILILDILRGSPMMATSMLGYCPIIGARFYGIGNEYTGILIGGTLVGWTALVDYVSLLRKNKLWLTPIIYLTVTIIIGFPRFGADFGGLLTGAAAFSLSYVLMFERPKRRRIIVVSTLLMLVVMYIFIVCDANGWTGEKSHVGKTVQLIKEQGVTALFSVISRKASMNLKLLRWTIWTRVLLAFIVILAVLFKRPKGVLKEIVQEFPNLALGIIGVIFGSVVTMLVNDSGVVAAATTLFFGILSLLYLVAQKVEFNRV